MVLPSNRFRYYTLQNTGLAVARWKIGVIALKTGDLGCNPWRVVDAMSTGVILLLLPAGTMVSVCSNIWQFGMDAISIRYAVAASTAFTAGEYRVSRGGVVDIAGSV